MSLDVVRIVHAAWTEDVFQESEVRKLYQLGQEIGLENHLRLCRLGFQFFLETQFDKRVHSASEWYTNAVRESSSNSYKQGPTSQSLPCSASGFWIEHDSSWLIFHSWSSTAIRGAVPRDDASYFDCGSCLEPDL